MHNIPGDILLGSTMLSEIVRRWRPEIDIASVSAITPDASMRRYFRVQVKGGALEKSLVKSSVKSIIAMYFESTACPEAGDASGKRYQLPSDESYVALTGLFQRSGIRVPKLYYDARDLKTLLIEDLGDLTLMQRVQLAIAAEEPEEVIDRYYRGAIDEILKLQRIPSNANEFVFGRRFTKSVYLTEMSEFTEFFLSPAGASSELVRSAQAVAEALATELVALPQVLVHRDFHSWNLLVEEEGTDSKIRVIDFQDALMGTRSYDLAALLNDRDTDAILGAERCNRLREYFAKQSGMGMAFEGEYYRALLQRDLKVVGRFEKLARVRGLTQYREWVPGTLQRVGSSLAWLQSHGGSSLYGSLLEGLKSFSADVALGADRSSGE